MYERMLDKFQLPTDEQIKEYVGNETYKQLMLLDNYLTIHYQISKELKFPFGNKYGWGYKFSHKSLHICYAFFEKRAFTVMIQIGDKQIKKLEEILNSLLKKTQELWLNHYPCGENGVWIHYRVLSDEELLDVFKLIEVKKKSIT
jgi:hypothetical protein